jgi:hypothetical protein
MLQRRLSAASHAILHQGAHHAVLRDRNGRLPKVTARNLSVDAAPRFLIRNKLIDAGDFIGDQRARNAAECEAEKFGSGSLAPCQKIQLTRLVHRELLNG